MSEGSAHNPYDFRAPIRSPARLAGREGELEQIDELLRGAAIGSPSHFSLFGPAGMGKSSLLNAVGNIAGRRDLLPVRVDLRDTLVESPLAFYGAVFDAALEALRDFGAIDDTEPVMEGWVQHTLLGNSDHPAEAGRYLQAGLLIAARMNGKAVEEVPRAVLQRDLALVLELGAREGLQGVVLELDSAEALEDSGEIAPSLMEFAQATPTLTIVTAGERAGPLQEAAPRAWSQIEVGPFRGPGQIMEAIMKPLADVEEVGRPPSFQTAREIFDLTDGRPYEVNLVNHFVWEAISQGEQEDFALSEAVLSRVLAELESRGRHSAGSAVDMIGRLSAESLRSIARLAPFEGLTVREIALGRLMFDEFDADALGAVEDEVTGELLRLAEFGVLKTHGERFEIEGGAEARLYLRYAAERRIDLKVEFGETYARLATAVCRRGLAEELIGAENTGKLLRGIWSDREFIDPAGGRWLDQVADGVAAESLSEIDDLLPGFEDPESLAEFAEKGAVLFGFSLQVGMRSVEYADLAINVCDLTAEEAGERAKAWFATHEGLLGKYGISLELVRCECLGPGTAKSAAAFSELRRFLGLVILLHNAGLVEAAIVALGDCIDRSEALIGGEPADPLVRSVLADAFNSLGFIYATGGERDKAAESLERAIELSITEEWLPRFNLAYLKALEEDFGAARDLAIEAQNLNCPAEGVTILHAWFPMPPDWEPAAPRHNVVSMHGRWVRSFVELQTQVFAALADRESRSALRQALDALSNSAPAPLLRLAGWTELLLFEDPEKASDLFYRAVHATDLDEIQAVRAEHELAAATVASQGGSVES
ncbi:MAG TPA: ATP-binding protein [Solirubrobacterales bacterium]|nr:ATP-binding protein [Solirubrobacterales bacterium]